MKLVCLNRLNRHWITLLDQLKRGFENLEVIKDPAASRNALEEATAVIAGSLSHQTLGELSQLKIIFVPYAGIDALPLKRIRQRSIRIANVHGNAPEVAERAVALALAFYGKIANFHDDLKAGRWHGFWAGKGTKDSWESISGKTCAVIGVGRIGTQIARRLKPFGCRTIGFRRRSTVDTGGDFDEMTDDLDHAIEQSELVFICLPLTPLTRGIFNDNRLSRMTEKFLVNVGRGELVVESALYRVLKTGVLKGAAIDAWYSYPETGETAKPPSAYPFDRLPNVILSPHVAGFTSGSAKRNIEQTIQNIRSYLKTGHPRWEANTHHMY